MWSEFLVYLRLGFTHVADLQAYDHILFIAALCAGYGVRDWKRLFWLATAFTIGHSITLALATLRIVVIDDALVELLIPVTIVFTSLVNVASPARQAKDRSERGKYAMALGFGLIHGMGFSNFLRAILGLEESIVWPLFAFNVGLEVGQIAILTVIVAVFTVAVGVLRMQRRSWVLVLSGATMGIALTIILNQLLAQPAM